MQIFSGSKPVTYIEVVLVRTNPANDFRRMKIFALAVLVATGLAASVQATTIAQWTFETVTPADLNNSTTQSTVADIGVATGTGLHASSATDWSTPAGNGSTNA
jgi:hypothetical protein